jgi:cob(I)alamin adenosyltransferase
MADIAVAREKGRNHSDQQCGVDTKMVEALEELIDDFSSRSSMPHDFTVPGETRCSAALDLARTIVRRAERLASTLDLKETILMYLNRLSDVCWTLARYEEGTSVLAKDHHASVRPHQRDTQDPKGRDIGAKD